MYFQHSQYLSFFNCVYYTFYFARIVFRLYIHFTPLNPPKYYISLFSEPFQIFSTLCLLTVSYAFITFLVLFFKRSFLMFTYAIIPLKSGVFELLSQKVKIYCRVNTTANNMAYHIIGPWAAIIIHTLQILGRILKGLVVQIVEIRTF